MFWGIVIGGAVVSAIFALSRGQNPIYWALSSWAGVGLLPLIPPVKGLGEQKRARQEVGNKLGGLTSAVVVGVLAVLGIVGVL